MIVMTGNPLSIRSIARVLNPAARRLSVCSNTRVKPASVFGKVVNSEFMIIYTISSGFGVNTFFLWPFSAILSTNRVPRRL